MVAFAVVGVEADRHKIGKLDGEPPVEALRHGSNQIARDEDVENGGDEGDLFAGRDGDCFCPPLIDVVNGPLHAPAVLGQLLFGGWDSFAPFCDGLFASICALRSNLFLLPGKFLLLSRYCHLPLFKFCGKCEVVKDVEYGQLVHRSLVHHIVYVLVEV